jgi:hypothetical protein
MYSRRLAGRVTRLESQFAPTSHVGPILIQCCEANGDVASEEGWYPSGYEPMNPQKLLGIAEAQRAQKSSGVLR